MKTHRSTPLLAATLSAGLAAPALGQLYVADDYNIGAAPAAGEYTEDQLKNQPAGLVNTGFANGPYNGGTGTGQFQATTVDLGGTLATPSSGKVIYAAAPLDGIRRSNARNLDGGALPASGPLYISHTVNRGGIPAAGGDGYVLTGFGNFVQPTRGATAGFLDGLFVGFAQNSTANPNSFGDLVIRARTTAAQTAEDIVLLDDAVSSTGNNTYTVVMKVDVNNGGGSGDPVTWFLDPTDFTSDITLASSAAATGSFASFAFGDASPDRLNYDSVSWNGNVFFDQPRIAGSSADLVIPEPATAALIGLAGLAFAGRRRRSA